MRDGSTALSAACLVAFAVACQQAQSAGVRAAAPDTQAAATAATDPTRATAPAAALTPATLPVAAAAPTRGTLVLSASTAGQLVPCGCSPDQRGGLPRAVAAVKQLRAEASGAAYVDAGDLLFESAVPRKGPLGAQAELKARTLARGEELLGAAARVVGARDLALGPQFVAQTRGTVPLLDAGGTKVPDAASALLLKAGDVSIGLLAGGLGSTPAESIRTRAAQLRHQGARAIVLVAQTPGGWQEAERLARTLAGAVDVVVLGHLEDPATEPDRADPGPPPLLAVEGHGQSLLRIDLEVPQGTPTGVYLAQGTAGKQAELKELDDRIARMREQARTAPDEMRRLYADKVRELEQRRAQAASAKESAPPGALVVTATFIALGPGAGEDPAARDLVAAYDDQVTQMNLRLAQQQPESCPAPKRGEAAFTGISSPEARVKSCAECHDTAAAFWAKTGHSHAYETLVAARKQFSLDCIRCHVTGWQQPGGVCRIDRTQVGGAGFAGRGKGRQDVQCEMCHGAASEHAKDPPGHIAAEVSTSVCVRCHEAANSPHFNDARYRPFIVGPGHGDPLAAGDSPHPRASGSGPNEALKASLKGSR